MLEGQWQVLHWCLLVAGAEGLQIQMDVGQEEGDDLHT